MPDPHTFLWMTLTMDGLDGMPTVRRYAILICMCNLASRHNRLRSNEPLCDAIPLTAIKIQRITGSQR